MTLDKFSLYDRIASLSFPTKLGRTNLCQKPYVQVETIEKGKESIDESESEEPLLYTRRRVVSRWPSQYMIAAFLILNAAVLTVIYFTAIGAASPQIISKLFPPAQYEERIFHPENLRPGPESEADWAAALPEGSGFLIVDEPERFGLPPGVAYKDAHKRYGVTWAHQYHCIWMLRTEFWALIQNNSALIGASLDDDNEHSSYLWHLAHCFGYLRQTIVCNMDMTLEYPTLGGPNEGQMNGYEVPHQCIRRGPWDEFMKMHAPDEVEVARIKSQLDEKHHHH